MPRSKSNRPRYKSGRVIPRTYGTSLRISDEDLRAGIYPPGDVRNEPSVKAWCLDALQRSVDLAPYFGHRADYVGHRAHCSHCGALSGV